MLSIELEVGKLFLNCQRQEFKQQIINGLFKYLDEYENNFLNKTTKQFFENIESVLWYQQQQKTLFTSIKTT